MSLLLRTESYIRSEQLLERGDQLIVAVSGGPDSTALLYLLTELAESWNLKLHVAHMEHGFRGEISRREAEWVRELAASLGWPCTIRHADIPAKVRAERANPQEAAREARYSFLIELASQLGVRTIALGHHADDQAETVLMRLLRGASLTGLAGMSPASLREGVKLVRPLLRIYKEDIIAYLEENRYEYCTDMSNLERTYTRNRLRLDLMPLLRSFNPEITQTLVRTADIIRDEDRLLNQLAEAEIARLFRRDEDRLQTASRNEWLRLDVALQRRVIKLILSYLCFHQGQVEMIHIEQIREAISRENPPSVTLHLPGVMFTREYDRLEFLRRHHARIAPLSYEYAVVRTSGRLSVPEAGMTLSFTVEDAANDMPFTASHGIAAHCAYFDMEELAFPLKVRSRKPGDRIQLPNTPGSKKLKDLFIDLKIPPSERDAVPLLFDAEDRLLWVCGIRRSRHALIQNETAKVLVVKLEQNERMSPNID